MKGNNLGVVRSVRGSVVDVFFPKRLPDIYSRLVTRIDSSTETEVISHLNANLVRCVALTQTSGQPRRNGSDPGMANKPLARISRRMNRISKVIADMTTERHAL